MELAGAPEEEREGGMDESVTKVAAKSIVSSGEEGRRRGNKSEKTDFGWRTMLQTPDRFSVALPVFFLWLLSW